MRTHRCWPFALLFGLALLNAPRADAQGALEPPGPPGPTMVTLDQLHSSLDAVNTAVTGLATAVDEVDFAAIAAAMEMLTNSLAVISTQADLLPHMDTDLHVMTNQLAVVVTGMNGLTKSLGDMDWTDILDIRWNVSVLTNVVVHVEAQLQQMSLALEDQQADLVELRAIEAENNALLRALTNSP
ncbi:MAG: hypothetical protein K8T26_09500 [Lentisphaerae bacterium]|nr:hypothetical protein [Lentisphaerota bacterium]